MKKSDNTKKSIFDYIKDNPWISSSQIANFLKLTKVAVFYHTRELLREDFIYKIWNTRAIRYYPKEKKYSMDLSVDFFEKLKKSISDEYEGLEDLDIEKILENILALLKADWTWLYWFDAFVEKIKKENNGNYPKEDLLFSRLLSFLISFFEEERKRRKNWFFDWTESLKIIILSYKEGVYIDKLLFTGIATLPHFGRLRQATELFYWKQDQNKALLEKAINYYIETIVNYIKINNIKYVIYTPPTLKRQVQFREVLKNILEKKWILLDEIKCEKVKTDILHTLRLQKELKWKDRIINAKSSIVVWNFENKINNLLIFDDNFTTWATINAIAWKMKNNWFTWNITAITITWNFEYIPGVTDEEEV